MERPEPLPGVRRRPSAGPDSDPRAGRRTLNAAIGGAGSARLLDPRGHKYTKGTRHRQWDCDHSNAACLGNRGLRPSGSSSP